MLAAVGFISSISRYHSHFGSIPVDASEYYRCSAHRHVVQHAMAKVLDGKLIHDSGLLDGDDVEHPPDTRSSDDHHVQFDLLSIASLQVAAEHAQGLGARSAPIACSTFAGTGARWAEAGPETSAAQIERSAARG